MEVLPDDPVMPTTVAPGSRPRTARASSAEGEGDVGDDDDRRAGLGQRPGGEDGGRPAQRGGRGVVVAVRVLAGQRGEQRTGYRLPRVDHDRAGHRHVLGAVS